MFFGIDLVKDRGTREPHTVAAAHILAVLKKVKSRRNIMPCLLACEQRDLVRTNLSLALLQLKQDKRSSLEKIRC